MTDDEIESVARRMCIALGLDPDEDVGHGWNAHETPAEQAGRIKLEGCNFQPDMLLFGPRWRLYRWKAAEAIAAAQATRQETTMLHDDFEAAIGAELGPGWRPIETAPKDGSYVLVLFDSAGEPIIRSARWEDGTGETTSGSPFERGWWSYRHSVTQEHLYYMTPIAWREDGLPDEWEDGMPVFPWMRGETTP